MWRVEYFIADPKSNASFTTQWCLWGDYDTEREALLQRTICGVYFRRTRVVFKRERVDVDG